MEKKLTFRLLGDTSNLDKAFKGVQTETNALGNTMKKLGTAVASAFAVQKVIQFGKTVVEASASIQAMEAQFNQVFKEDNAKAVELIQSQVDELGIHADRLTGTWSKFGGQVKGAGMEGQQALDAVTKATMLSADASAFYDVSLESASASLASFMKGNFEAGDAIGVFTNAKQMDVRANEMYGKSWADLTEAERQWLLLETVEKTYEMNGAMGQAQREADAYENVMGNLRATMQRFYAVVGEPVLEAFLVVVGKVTEGVTWLTEKIKTMDWSKFTEGGNKAKEYLEPVIQIAQRLGDKVMEIWQGTVKPFIQGFISMLQELYKENKDKISLVIATFDAFVSFLETYIFPIIVGLFNVVKDNFDKIKGTIQSALDIVSGILKVFIGIFTADWNTMKEGISQIWKGLWNGIYNIVSGAWNILSGAFDIVFNAIKGWFDDLIEDGTGWGADLVKGLWNGISSLATWVKNKIQGFVEGIGSTIKEFFGIASPSKLMAEYGQYIDEGLALGIQNNSGKPVGAMQSLANAVDGAFQKVNSSVKNTVSVIQKEFELWKLQNQNMVGSSEELKLQLEAQQKQHELLTQQIEVAQSALKTMAETYGESSEQAINYKNQLLDLQIEQAKLTESIAETTKALNNMADAQLKARIQAVDSQSSEQRSASRSQSKKESENFYNAFKDQINEISRKQNVDLGVAQAIFRNQLEKGTVKLATGGIVTKPTLAMIGEGKESEAVIPLSKLENFVGGGVNGLIVNIYGSVGVDDIGEQIVQTLRRKGVMSFA